MSYTSPLSTDTCMKMNSQQQAAFDKIVGGRNNVFVTGPAGCGKSFLISHIVKWAYENDVRVGITASTGAAAILIGGRTIHSYLGIGLAKSSAQDLAGKVMKRAKNIVKRVRALKMLILEEISMISDELLDKIAEFMELIRGDPRPFGGVQVVVCGDFHQLPSVDGDFCFNARSWARAKFETCLLTINMRQKNDDEFLDILSRARIGRLTDADVNRLQELRATEFPYGIKPTRLFSKRADVDRINNESLKELLTSGQSKFTLEAVYSSMDAQAWAAAQGVPVSTDVCVGAQVVITWNIAQEMGIVNGTRGVIQAVSPDATLVMVRVRNGSIVPVERITVKNEDDPNMWVSYFPIQLAYSLTFHKCQGMTLDAAEIDVGPSVFEFGQAYTALSRVKSLDALRVTNILRRSFRAHPEVTEFYRKYQ